MASKLLPMNEGGADRAVRIVVGLVLIALAFVGPKTPWGYLGIIPLATGFLGSCPIYTVFGINTCGVKKA